LTAPLLNMNIDCTLVRSGQVGLFGLVHLLNGT